MTPEQELDELTTAFNAEADRVNRGLKAVTHELSQLLDECNVLKNHLATPEQRASLDVIVDGLHSLSVPDPVVVPDDADEPEKPGATPKAKPAGATGPHAAQPPKH